MPANSNQASPHKKHDTKSEASNVASCPQCKRDITEGTFVTVPNTDLKLHSDCFRCYNNCGTKLAQSGYAKMDNKFYCPTCSKQAQGGSQQPCYCCGKALGGQCVTCNNQTFHKECFKCFSCKDALTEKFFLVNGRPVCGKCSQDRENINSLKTCKKCKEEIKEEVLMANQNFYHARCFTCDHCSQKMGSSIAPHGDKIYHIQCYQAMNGLICVKCNSGINGRYFESEGKAIHPECLDELKKLAPESHNIS